jgi:hypothetical protein
VAEYPDTGATVTKIGPARNLAFPGASDEPLPDVVAAALRADPGNLSS